MRTIKRCGVLIIAAVAVLVGPARMSAAAGLIEPDAAYAPYGTITGSETISPGLGAMPTPESWCMSINVNLPSVGTAIVDEFGPYVLSVCGSSALENLGGTVLPGSGTVNGSGPEGSLSGTFTYVRAGIHYYINGGYAAAGESHTLQLWMDMFPSPTVQNPVTTATLIGHGAFIDTSVSVG